MKKEYLGYILGSICFLPTFLVVVKLGYMNLRYALALLFITQIMWLWSITLCTWDLDIENRQLKKKLKEYEMGEKEN